MKRLLVLLALAGIGGASACGDDDDKPAGESSHDAGTGLDASKPADDAAAAPDTSAPKGVQVENLGAKCKVNTECAGPAATCALTLGDGNLSVDLKDGYCTAMCTASSECGAGGGCPLAEVTAAIPIQLPFDLSAVVPIPSLCLDKCTKSASDCRDGYECKSVGDVIPAELKTGAAALLLLSPAFRTTYCIPPIEVELPAPVDASVPVDASTALKVVGGLDAGN
jgi:hypothetical protein